MENDTVDEGVGLATQLCVAFEGFRSRPYICPAGVPTIGYGNTRYLDGSAVTLKDPPISKDEAFKLLYTTLLKKYLNPTLQLCPSIQTSYQLGAILDFTYNCGVGALKASTLRRKINADDWDAAKVELRKWVRGGGRVLPGLVKRREAEIRLIGE